MIRVLFQCVFTAACVWAYNNGASPTASMFAIGWCSAFTVVAFLKAISHPHGSSSQGL